LFQEIRFQYLLDEKKERAGLQGFACAAQAAAGLPNGARMPLLDNHLHRPLE
jgi:hypothetical protein